MSTLFMNQQDYDDLIEEIEEDFGLKPKDNKEKKQTVEDRIIERCEKVQEFCSSAIDRLPIYREVRKAI